MRARALRASIAVTAVLVSAACGGRSPRRDNDVRVAISADPSSLSLIGKTDTNATMLASLISDGLVGYDVEGRYVPLVARSWEFSPDGKTLTFHLRDGVLWHDGERVTSRDVAYTAMKVQDPATQARSWASAFAIVDAVDTPDDLTAVVHYASPYADALEQWRVPLVPEHVAKKDAVFLGGTFSRHPIGCGPFAFVSYRPGQSVVLAAFDRYWGGRPAMDRMVVKIVASERTGYESLLLKDLDLYGVAPDLFRESQSSEAGKRFAQFAYYRLNAYRIDWNQYATTPFFQDKRVRRAMLLALDRKRFAETVAAGRARPGVSSYPPESPWAEPSITAIPFDPVACAKLLDEAGWRQPAAGGVREKDGKRFSFTMILNAGAQEIADRSAAWMQQSLAEVGIEMKVEKLAWEAFQQRRKSHAFEAAMGSVQLDPTPDRFDLYHSKARDNGFNYGGFSDPEVDRLLDAGRVTIDPAARREIYFQLQRRLDDLQPIAMLFQFAQSVLYDPALQGLVPSAVGLFQTVPGPRAWHWSGARVGP